MKINTITIENYKSIKKLDKLPLTNLNILVGSNGAGKSNLISFFKLLNKIIEKQLKPYSIEQGIDKLLCFGLKQSKFILGEIDFGNNKYRFKLKPANEGFLFIDEEENYFNSWHSIGRANEETKLSDSKAVCGSLIEALKLWKIYHFHDTSSTAAVKQYCHINNNRKLEFDAGNLATFLYKLKQTNEFSFNRIEETIKLVAPYFDKFILEPNELNPEKIKLEWQQKESDNYFDAFSLSDGTLRFICLATLLLQPNPPDTLIIDEPELGLHPYAISVLASLVKAFSNDKQIIASTQSVTLLDYFEPEEIIVADKQENSSVFKRLSSHELKEWIEEYSMGEIWEKNIIGGRP
ncbi:MAG: ATPase [Candidatus Parabeggiatoa sp. nov. 1]|nr:MAG: ATPase [Gammaproteobacteria bacterium]